MESRNTIQRSWVLDAVRSLRGHVTADEVYEYVIKNHPSVGKGTVYRNLNILSEQGEIKRVEIPNGPNRFDFTLTRHYHAICVKCDSVFDADMDMIPELEDLAHSTDDIKLLDYDILFKGICSKCRAE